MLDHRDQMSLREVLATLSQIKHDDYLLMERSYGSFQRSFRVPDSIDADDVKATFDKGVLKVTMSKRAEAVKTEKRIPIGTIKSWMGYTHFLTRGLEGVKAEMSLCVLAYNIKRMIAIMGVQPLIAAVRG